MTNLELLDYSIKHPNPLIDPYYNKGELVITPTKNTRNTLMKSNARLIELITVFNYLAKEGKDDNSPEVTKIVNQVIEILDCIEGINYSAFSQFFMVYNSTYSSYRAFSLERKKQFIFQMLQLYCKERHGMYLNHGYTDSILQVMSDNYSHKRNSKTSIVKIMDVLEKRSINRIASANNFEGLVSFVLLPDKGDKDEFLKLKSIFSIKMKSAETEQGKLPDLVVKIGGEYFIIEAKMMKGSGGGQDKQLVEIINFIRFSEEDKRIHYLTYLDGEYADLLFATNRTPKLNRQYEDLVACLKANPGNYFVNSFGFEKLIDTFVCSN